MHADNWVFPGCPHAGPALAIGTHGERHVVWYTGQPGAAGEYYARLDTAGAATAAPVPLARGSHLSPAHASVVALADGGAMAAYDVAPDGSRAIRLAVLDADGKLAYSAAVPNSSGGRYPQLVDLGEGSGLVAWTADGVKGTEIRFAKVSTHAR